MAANKTHGWIGDSFDLYKEYRSGETWLSWSYIKNLPTLSQCLCFCQWPGLALRYAYSEETGDDYDEEGVALTSGALKVSRDIAAMREFNNGLAEDLEEDMQE